MSVARVVRHINMAGVKFALGEDGGGGEGEHTGICPCPQSAEQAGFRHRPQTAVRRQHHVKHTLCAVGAPLPVVHRVRANP